jgi:hypothetical protein
VKFLNALKLVSIFCFVLTFSLFSASAQEQLQDPSTYLPQPGKTGKEFYDDPTDLTVTQPFSKILPPAIWKQITFDKEKMKQEYAELLGFTAPEVVGKIAPEIKLGKYTYQDLEKYPGLKELFPPMVAEHIIKPGGPPFVGNIPEFEIVPTSQFYQHLRLIEETKRNIGKTKLDKDGYLVEGTWQGGIPFPRPSDEHKAQQVFYNFEKRSVSWDECWALPGRADSYDKNLIRDKLSVFNVAKIRWKARTLFPPYGWLDERAERNDESVSYSYIMYEPRSQRGTILLRYLYDGPEKQDASMVYVPSLRRIRKLSSTDTQDPTGDMTYDDQNMLLQKITPKKYPYKFDIISEREYLMFYSHGNMPTWCDSKNGYALRDVKLMRRPCYVLQMTQMDPNYVYSKRIYYLDKETFDAVYNENYDQRGRLYRVQYYASSNLNSESGTVANYGSYSIQRDLIDLHSTTALNVIYPAPWSRTRFDMEGIMRGAK